MEIFSCKSLCERVSFLITGLTPAIHEICVVDLQQPEDKRNAIFQQLYNILIRAADLIKKCENSRSINPLLNYRYASQILKLEKEITDLMGLIPAHILLDTRRLMTELRDVNQLTAERSMMMTESIFKQASVLTADSAHNSMMLQEKFTDDTFGPSDMEEDSSCTKSCDTIPTNSQTFVGLEKSMGNVKELLFQTHVSVVGVQCMGGGGKTTLALALANDPQIKGFFCNMVVFLTVSQSPNLKGILETMWDKIVGSKRPEFQSVEDAHRQLHDQLLKLTKPTLVILDDVWSRANLETLLFEGTSYKTLVTTRDRSTIPQNASNVIYQLPLLSEDDSLALFCFWAFGQTSIPGCADPILVKEVQKECKGLPLALKVIGSSLRGEPLVTWQSAKNKLSKGETISDYHREGLLRRLETSIDVVDDVLRECFLDLGAFPEDRKICVDALLDLWVYGRQLEWNDAFVILLELARRNLLSLTSNAGNGSVISSGDVSDVHFSQHGVMRDLALYLGYQESSIRRTRLIMPRKENNLPGKWELLKNEEFSARIVSIHTGPMNETQWSEMNFQDTEALFLIFTASDYSLPPFLKSMKKLKFLTIFNYGSKRAEVRGLEHLSLLTQLKSVRLERLIAPPVLKWAKALPNLEKLSLSLCQGFGNNHSTDINLKLPKLQDFNIDHCSDLEELSSSLCFMPSVRTWSITNCHQVQKLPFELGNLSSLIVLRLSTLPGLNELPLSIGKLVNLEYLDISLNGCLKELPQEIGELKRLKEIEMRECSRLRKLPTSVCRLTSLKHVICDEKIGSQWLKAKSWAIPELRVEIVEAQFSLEWLDD